MSSFLAKIDIMPHKELLDPQGKTVAKNMGHMQLRGVDDVRIGKHIEMKIQAASEEEARDIVEQSCRKLLANLITETYSFEIGKV